MTLEEYERAVDLLVKGIVQREDTAEAEAELRRLHDRDDAQYMLHANASFVVVYEKMFFNNDGRISKGAERYLGPALQYVDGICEKLDASREFVIQRLMLPNLMSDVRALGLTKIVQATATPVGR